MPHSVPQIGSWTRSNIAALLQQLTCTNGCCFSVKLIIWDRAPYWYNYTSSSTQVSLDSLMYHCIAYGTDRPEVELISFSIIHFESDLTKSIGWLPSWKKNICIGIYWNWTKFAWTFERKTFLGEICLTTKKPPTKPTLLFFGKGKDGKIHWSGFKMYNLYLSVCL